MKRNLDKTFFIAEMVLLGIPFGVAGIVLAVYGLIAGLSLAFGLDHAMGPESVLLGLGMILAAKLAMLAVVSLWRLSARYLMRGAASLDDAATSCWWWMAMGGALLLAVGAFTVKGGLSLTVGLPGPMVWLGAPLLIPAMHLWTAYRKQPVRLRRSQDM